jgi:hypothetical protein
MPSEVRRIGRIVFMFALAVYLATAGGSMATDIMSYEVTKGIVEHGTVAMSFNVFQMEAHRGIDGRYYAPYGIGHAVYSIPFYLLGRLGERWTGLDVGKREALPKAGFVVGSAVASALIVWVAFLFAWRLSRRVNASIKTALALGFATLIWPYSKFGFSAPLAALCVLCGTYGMWVGTRVARPAMLAVGGAGFGAALLVRQELALLCVPVALWFLAELDYDWRRVVRLGLIAATPIVLAALVTLYYNAVRFGNPFDTGYLRDETVALGSLWTGLSGLLVSPGRSLFVYSPILLAGVLALGTLRGQDPRTMWLLAGEVLILLFFYASLAHWDAERSYGPRYLLPAIPLLALPLVTWFARTDMANEGRMRSRMLTALVAVSVLVQVPGVLVDFSKVGHGARSGGLTMDERRWTWSGSGLSLNSRAVATAIPANLKRLATGERPPVTAALGDARDFSEQFAFSLDFWWLYLFYLGAISAPVAVALGCTSVSVAVLMGWRLYQLQDSSTRSAAQFGMRVRPRRL